MQPVVLAFLALATILRLILVNQSLWLDEAIEVLAVKNNSYLSLITKYSLGDFHPPLYHLILKFWTSIFGFSEIGARSLSVFLGVATVFIIYLIGKEIKNKKLGFLGALFLATSSLHIYYSQEARMYAMAAFFIAALVYFFLETLKTQKIVFWILFTLTLILTFYTDYLPYLILIPLNLYVFLQPRLLKPKFLAFWLTSQLIVLLFLLPWLPLFLKQIGVGSLAAENLVWQEVVGGFSLKAIPITAAKFIVGRISLHNKISYALLLTLPAIYFTFLIVKAFFEERKEKFLIFFWFIIPIIVGWLVSIFIPVFSYFRFLFVLPAMYLLLAFGILSFKNLKVQTVLVVLVLFVNFASQIIFWTNPGFWREDWKKAVFYIEGQSLNQNTASIFISLAQTAPYQYYAKKVPFYGPSDWQNKNLQTIWLSRYVQPIFDPDDSLRKEIEAYGFVKVEEKDFNGVVFWRYQKAYANRY